MHDLRLTAPVGNVDRDGNVFSNAKDGSGNLAVVAKRTHTHSGRDIQGDGFNHQTMVAGR